MTMPTRKSDTAPRRLPARKRARRAPQMAGVRPPSSVAKPGIIDAVSDQHGGRWVRYGTQRNAIWFSVAALLTNAPEVFRQLSTVGATFITQTRQQAFKREVEAETVYRPALVAMHPGWLEGFYVFGDGALAAPRSDDREVIIAFERSPKFVPSGTLAQWQRAVGPFVAEQPLSYFVLALALSGPLLRFLPSGFLNPQVELVGEPEKGKTAIGRLGASVWAGEPGSDCGGGESLDMTLNSLDTVKFSRRDGFFFGDEGNLAGGGDPKRRREFASQVVFKLATTGAKRRMGDPVQGENARLASFSTTNTPLADLIEGSEDEREAAQSRMVTMRIAADAPHGVFAHLPHDYDTARAAVEALQEVTDQYWGAAGRAFVERLVDEADQDEEALKGLISRSLASYMRLDRSPKGSARVQKTFALVFVTAALARRWGILPEAWGSPIALIQAVACDSSHSKTSDQRDELDEVHAYLNRHRAELVDVSDLPRPLSRNEFEGTAGFLRSSDSGHELLVPAVRFQAAFPEYEHMMRALRCSGHARTERGEKPKLTIKTPKAICGVGRVYCIRVKLRINS